MGEGPRRTTEAGEGGVQRWPGEKTGCRGVQVGVEVTGVREERGFGVTGQGVVGFGS